MKRFFAFSLTSLFFAAVAHASITGTIVDDDGAPIIGASVRSFAPATSREIVARVLGGKIERDPIAKIETAADGAFRIESGSSPLVTLVVTAPGRQYVELDTLDGEDLGPIMISLQKTRTIRVTANGKPVAGAIVLAGSTWAATTSAAGTVDLPPLYGTNTRVAVVHRDYAPAPFATLGPQKSEIRLAGGVAVKGKIVAQDGKTAVPHANLSIAGLTIGESGDDGAFTIAHAPADWKALRVNAGAQGSAVVTNDGSASHTIRLRAPATLSGTLHDSKTKAAIAGVRVTLALRIDQNASDAVTTDSKGAFSFAVAPGQHTISGTNPNYSVEPTQPLNLSSGDREVRTYNATPIARIQGKVIDESKSPVAGALVARGFNGMVNGGGRVAITNSKGEFTMRTFAQQGEFDIQASKPGFATGYARVSAVAGQTTSGVSITMPKGIAFIVRVIDKQQKPVGGVFLSMMQWRDDPSLPRGSAARCGGQPCMTTNEGIVSIRLAPGKYDIAAGGESIVAKTASGIPISEKNSPYTITVDYGVELAGRVIYADNAPVPDAIVTYQTNNDIGRTISADANGAFSFPSVPRGSGTIHATLTPNSRLVSARREVSAPANDIVLTMARGGSIRGPGTDGSSPPRNTR